MSDEQKLPDPVEPPSVTTEKAAEDKPEKKRHEITRDEACRRIGCSVMQVQRWEKSGDIRVRREARTSLTRGRVWLDSEDVDRVARSWVPRRQTVRERVDSNLVASNARGKLAAACFPLFQQKCPVGQPFDERQVYVEVVAQTGGDPALVRELYEEWCLAFSGGIQKRTKKERERAALELQKERERTEGFDIYRRDRKEWTKNEREAQKFRLEAARLEAEIAAKKAGGG